MRTYKGAEFSRYTREVPMQTLGLPPTNLTAVSSATDSIQLQWDDVTSGELGFHVYKKGPADPVFTKLLVTEANMAGTLDDGLTEGAVYQYKVTTFTLGGESTFVGPASAITLPAAPQNLAAQPQSDLSVTLTWTDESQGEQGVRIYRSAHLENAFAQIGRVPEGGITYADTAAQEATEYDYYVAGYNASGQGPQTPAIFVTSVPAAPLALNARPVSTSQIHLTWTDNSAAEDGYRLERDLKSEVSVLAQVPAGSTRYSDTGYAEGALVSYQLYAFNAAGDSIATPLVETMTMPNTPTNLQALVGQDGVVALSWTDKSRTEDGYKIFRKTEAGEFQSIGTVGPNETTFEDATLDLSQPAIYQVCAYNPFTNSEFSNTAGVPPEEENDDDSGDDDEAGNGKSSDKNESDSGSGCGC
jgi:fibronectin type 3 domain-containing protein